MMLLPVEVRGLTFGIRDAFEIAIVA